jgi:hypothetical protein
MPVACIFAALGLLRLGLRWPVLARGGVLAAVVAVTLAIPSWAVAQDINHLREPTTREQASSWIKANLPAGAKLVTDPFFRLPLAVPAIEEKLAMVETRPGAKARLVAKVLRVQLKNARPGTGYYVLASRNYPESPSFGIVDQRDYYSVQDYLDRGAEYFAVGLPRYGEVEAQQYRVFYGDLDRCCDVLHEIPAGADPRIAPPVRIYRVRR